MREGKEKMGNSEMQNEEMHPDDMDRVKAISPGMMVLKRFLRNRLAIVGIAIIAFMFLFSFVGGMIIPYSESQVFYTTEQILKDYAGASRIEQYQVVAADGVTLPSDIYSKTIIAASTKKYVFETRDKQILGLGKAGDEIFLIFSLTPVNRLLRKNAGYEEAVLAAFRKCTA